MLSRPTPRGIRGDPASNTSATLVGQVLIGLLPAPRLLAGIDAGTRIIDGPPNECAASYCQQREKTVRKDESVRHELMLPNSTWLGTVISRGRHGPATRSSMPNPCERPVRPAWSGRARVSQCVAAFAPIARCMQPIRPAISVAPNV